MKVPVFQLVVSLLVCGLIVWHTVYWHSIGFYLKMFEWLHIGKTYIVVLYNLALMVVLGIGLGFLMEKIVHIISYENTTRKN